MNLRAATSLIRFNNLLRQGRALSKREAADQLGVTPRHVQRLVGRLRDQGVPVKERRRDDQTKEFYLDGADLQVEDLAVPLSERQLLALLVAAEAARSVVGPTPLSGPLERALTTLFDYLPPYVHPFELEQTQAHWHFGEAPSVDIDPDVFDALGTAISHPCSVEIDYLTASTGRYWKGRCVDPLMIAVRGGSWLLVAYCHERQGLRDFALAGIDRVTLREEDVFTPPADFDRDAYFRGRFRAVSGDAVHVVRLLVEADRAAYFRRKRYHPTQEIAAEDDDGRLVVSYRVEGLKEVRSFVQSWGPGVTVLEPSRLAEIVAEQARDVAHRYASDEATDA